MKKECNEFTVDFETSTEKWLKTHNERARVWAFSICSIDDKLDFYYGTNIVEFLNFFKKRKNSTAYFHNIKYDAQYIISYLLLNKYECVDDEKDLKTNSFYVCVNEMGQFYKLTLCFYRSKNNKYIIKKVIFLDSLKIFNFSVEQIAEDFKLPIKKLKIDYDEYRPINHKLTEEEIAYIHNDVEIMARALKIIFDMGHKKMTIGSNALNEYKNLDNKFDDLYPVLDIMIDDKIRDSYKGGWVYLNPIYKNKRMKNGIVIDKNSMHPSHMYYDYMPCGTPLYYEGKYEEDKIYPLYIQNITCKFQLRKGKLPMIQIKNGFGFNPTEYLETSYFVDEDGNLDEFVTLTLTSVDLKLFLENYDVWDNLGNFGDVTYNYGYKFMATKGSFVSYIDKQMLDKMTAKAEGNGANYLIAKLFMNSLYGKFGKNPRERSKHPYLDDNDVLHYHTDPDATITDSIYCAVASFITAYSRNDIIRSAQKIRDYSLKKYGFDAWIYADTDSLHIYGLTEEEIGSILPLDDYKLNYYKIENKFTEGVFIRTKCYIEEEEISEEKYNKLKEKDKHVYIKDNKYYFLHTTVAGMPKKLGKYVTLDNFKEGFSVLACEEEKEHKLRYKQVPGGVILVDTDFTIKVG